MSGHEYFIYILSNISGTLYIYIGVTSDLERRIFEHKNGLREWFTKNHRCNRLVYFDIEEAIVREKQLKWWTRKKKESLIWKFNPTWKNLCLEHD